MAIEADLSLPAQRVIRVLGRIVAWRGYPRRLRMDNGSEFISATLAEWADNHDIKLEFIKPCTPTQNSYVERFNQTYGDEILNMYVFNALNEVREITDNWIREYNEDRQTGRQADSMTHRTTLLPGNIWPFTINRKL